MQNLAPQGGERAFLQGDRHGRRPRGEGERLTLWGDREKGVRSKAVWAGFGCQTGLPGSRPISGREPEKK